MGSPIAEAHIAAQARLRELATQAAVRAWDNLGNYDAAILTNWLSIVVPLVLAAQRQSAALTTAFVAQALSQPPAPLNVAAVAGAPSPVPVTPQIIPRRPPVPIDVAAVVGAPIRAGVTPETVYRRPLVTVWTALAEHKPWTQAVAAGRARVDETVAMDIQNTMRHTLRAIGETQTEILGYQRVPDATACEFCKLIAGRRYLTSHLQPVHPRCVAGDTLVATSGGGAHASDLGGAQAATRRWYAGQVVLIETAAGNVLTVTPNHPVLTDHGWVAAGLLREGDSVLSSLRRDGVVGRVPDEQYVPTRIEEHFRAHRMGGLVSVPFAAEVFHGDVGDGHVDVVFPDGRVDSRILAALAQPLQQQTFAERIARTLRLNPARAQRLDLVGLGDPAHGVMRCRCAGGALGRGLSGGGNAVLLRRRAEGDPVEPQVAPDRTTTDVESARQLQHRIASFVQLDSVRHTRRVDWQGHVFNLVTSEGWYTANRIVTHNCGCGVDIITAANRGDFTGKPENDLEIVGDGVVAAVREHGELGPLLVDGTQHFTGPDEIP